MSQELTTEAVAERDRFEYWREIICAVYVKLDAEPVGGGGGGGPFEGTVTWSPCGETTVSRVSSDAQIVTRSLDAPNDDCLLSLQLAGVGRVTQGGKTAVLQPGDFALYDAAEHYQLAFDEPLEQLVIQFPRRSLIARNVHVESAVARTNRSDRGAGAILRSFAQSLDTHGPTLGDAERAQLGTKLVDLAAIALSADPPEESVAEFNRQRVLSYAGQRLHDPALNVTTIAQAFGVSPRTIQKLFAADDIQLGTRIRQARLQRAREALIDPQHRHHTVTVIAADNGFAGPTQFARAFRAAYGCSPTDYRRAHRSDD
ncbi:MAG: AraC family transcriptional regulator [Actinomycetota bacterium]